jgi:hypothetical protein
VSGLPGTPEYDEIFLLRYVLTWEKKSGDWMGNAEKAIRSTIQWRTQHAQASVLQHACILLLI